MLATREAAAWRVAVESEGTDDPRAGTSAASSSRFTAAGDGRRVRGAGLGLATCRRIVHRHGGDIGVVPAGNAGNWFFFTLPA